MSKTSFWEKIFVLCVVTALLLTVVVGCGNGAATLTESTSGQTETTTAAETALKSDVTLSFIKAATDPENRAFYEKYISEFTEKTGIKVNYEEAAWGDIDTKLNMAFASGKAPDVIRYALSSVAQRVSMGQYGDLTEFIKGWNSKDDIMKSAYDYATYNSKIYGISVYVGGTFMMYRKDMFQEAGIDSNKPPQTWDELKEYARMLTKKDGNKVVRAGVQIPTLGNAHHHVIPLVLMNGADVVDYQKNIPNFTDPKFVEAVEYLVSFNKEGLLIPYNFVTDEDLFKKGESAIASTSDLSRYTAVITTHPEWKDKIGVAPQVSKDGKTANFGGAQILFMNSNTQYKNEAWEFIKYFFEPDIEWDYYKMTGVTPVLKSLKEKYISDNPDVNKVVLSAMETSVGNPTVTWAPLFIKYLQQAYEQSMYNEKTVEQALKDAQNDLLAEINK